MKTGKYRENVFTFWIIELIDDGLEVGRYLDSKVPSSFGPCIVQPVIIDVSFAKLGDVLKVHSATVIAEHEDLVGKVEVGI